MGPVPRSEKKGAQPDSYKQYHFQGGQKCRDFPAYRHSKTIDQGYDTDNTQRHQLQSRFPPPPKMHRIWTTLEGDRNFRSSFTSGWRRTVLWTMWPGLSPTRNGCHGTRKIALPVAFPCSGGSQERGENR